MQNSDHAKTSQLSGPLAFCRRLITTAAYCAIRFGLPLSMRLFAGCKRSTIGSCTVIAPQKQMQLVLDGINLLKTIDLQMFQQLTAGRPFMFWYNPEHITQLRDIFSITDNFLSWGKEGVSVFFVQCVLETNMEHVALTGAGDWTYQDGVRLRREVQIGVLDWIKRQPFSPELIKEYEEIRNATG
jgi:hypothetical protein